MRLSQATTLEDGTSKAGTAMAYTTIVLPISTRGCMGWIKESDEK